MTARANHGDSLTSEIISENWQQFLSLHDTSAAFPYHGYLFEVGDEYIKSLKRVQDAIMALPQKERLAVASKSILEERALVRRILSMLEHALYQAAHAEKHKDKTRALFLKDVLHYYTDRALTNPRICWYWIESGGNQRIHMEQKTRSYCERRVNFSNYDEINPFSKILNS